MRVCYEMRMDANVPPVLVRGVPMRLALALFLGLSLYAVPAKADTIAPVGINALWGNPYSVSDSRFEFFATSLEFDRTTQAIVSGSMDTQSFGSVGTFAFDGLTISPTKVPTKLGLMDTLAYTFLWDNGHGDNVTFTDADVLNDPHWYASVGLSGPDATGWQFTSIVPLSNTPFAAGYLFPYGDPAPSPTPEPSSLILLGLGLVGAVFMSRRLVTS
jgi:hypothetical protein